MKLRNLRITFGNDALVTRNLMSSSKSWINTSAAAAEVTAAADGSSGIGGMKKVGGITSGDCQSSGSQLESGSVKEFLSSFARRIAVYGRQKRK